VVGKCVIIFVGYEIKILLGQNFVLSDALSFTDHRGHVTCCSLCPFLFQKQVVPSLAQGMFSARMSPFHVHSMINFTAHVNVICLGSTHHKVITTGRVPSLTLSSSTHPSTLHSRSQHHSFQYLRRAVY
jgi:hypothetical protein